MSRRTAGRLSVVRTGAALLAVVGAVTEVLMTTPFDTEKAIVSRVLIVLALTSYLLEERGRREILLLALLSIPYVAIAPFRLEGETSGLATALGVASVVVFFAVPFPALVYVAHSRQDEMQRSLATLASTIAFFATMAGAAGYWVLRQVLAIPEVSIPWVLVFGAIAWLGAWVILRARML